MKKIFKYFGILLSVSLMGALTSCTLEEENLSADLGLGVKVFFPTKVVAGQPMTINGSGFSDATEIVFPDDVSVTDFEIVSNEMIRVTAPAGINPEGGKIIVRTADDEAESRLPLTLGSTSVSGYSKMPGELITGGEQLTIFGEDLEFITSVELKDPDGNPLIVNHEDFYRKGTSSVIVTVPKKVYSGVYAGIIRTFDRREFTMDEFEYEEGKDEGYWEITKRILWENEGSLGATAWTGGPTYRFSSAERSTGEEIYAFPMEDWAIIKEGTFRIAVEVTDASNIRLVDAWWSSTYGGTDYNCMEILQEEEDGTKYVEINIKEDGNLYGNIDEKHLQLVGDSYTPLAIYVVEETWVEGEAGHWEKNSIWKNDTSLGACSWNGGPNYRFGLDGNDGNNECVATFPAEVWAIIKDGTFRVAVDVNDASNIRVTTGWWTGAYGGAEHNCIDLLQEEEDGTKYIELNIKEDGNLYDNIDVQHLLLVGDSYTPLEIYTMEWVEGGSAEPEENIIWEGEVSLGWDDQHKVAVPAECFEGVAAGTKMVLHYSQHDQTWGQAQICYCNYEQIQFDDPNGLVVAGTLVPTDVHGWFADGILDRSDAVVLTQTILDNIQAKKGEASCAEAGVMIGLIIQGQDMTFTKITLE